MLFSLLIFNQFYTTVVVVVFIFRCCPFVDVSMFPGSLFILSCKQKESVVIGGVFESNVMHTLLSLLDCSGN